MPLPAAGGVVVTWILPSLAALFVAWTVQKRGGGSGGSLKELFHLPTKSNSNDKGPQESSSSSNRHQYSIFVIGDLHGDVECAKYWVGKTGLISSDDDNDEAGSWIDPTSQLVFLGDYIDKGPQSKYVVEYVKSLTEQYPDHVTAIMGNHEMELLLDRDSQRWKTWSGTGYFGLAYSSVHPGEYLNYLENNDEEPTEEDQMIVEVLYNVSAEVYARRLHQQLRLVPPSDDGVGIEKSALQFITDEDLRNQIANRLLEYQTSYLNAYRSGTELGDWLEQRPIVAHINDTIFVHGGISNYGSALLKQVGVKEANKLFAEHSHQDKILEFMTQTQIGQILYDMLTFRGNHKDGACEQLQDLLPDGATRLGVGHTPDQNIRLMCDNNFMALDSSLGRWFRNSGNLYCHGKHPIVMNSGSGGGGSQQQQQPYLICDEMNQHCEGQIIKLTNNEAGNGRVEIIQ